MKLINNIKDYKCLDKIIIVDNCSIDDSYDKLNAHGTDLHTFLFNGTEHGYSTNWYTSTIEGNENYSGYSIASSDYYEQLTALAKDIKDYNDVNRLWIGIVDSTEKIECLTVGYINTTDEGKPRWTAREYHEKINDVLDDPKHNKFFSSMDDLVRYWDLRDYKLSTSIYAVGYLTDFSVDNTSVMVENEITVGKDADIQFTIYNNADNISFAADFIFDAQQNQDTTFQIWLSATPELDTTNTETSICIYEDALRILPDDGRLENYFDFDGSITISNENVNKLFKDFKTTGETEAYIFVRAGGREGKGEFITGELYSKDNDSEGQLVHIKADQDIKYSFVIDDTGSMSNEIGAVRSGLLRFIDSLRASLEEGEAAPLMQLITFKDNVTQRITTNNLDEMYAAVSGLYASGGGDWPEYSNHAIAQAVKNIGTNGTILFATDAESHAGVNMNNVLAEARSKGVRINSIISGSVSSYSGGYSYAAAPALMAMSSGESAEEVTDPFGDSAETAGAISVDSTTSGVVNYGDNRYDWMKVYLHKDYTYSFALNTVDDKRAFLNLYSTDGKTAIDEGNAGDIIYFSPTASGTYYLRTRAFDYEDTSYSLNVAQTGEPSTIGTTLESFSVLSTYTGGVYEVRSEVKSGDTTGYEAIIYNSLASTIGAAVISCGPYSAQKGSTLDVVISGYGTNWKAGETEVVFDSDKISTLSVTVISPTQLSATIEISSECSNGVYDVSVSTGTEKATGVDVLTVKTASSNPSLVSVVSSGFTQGGDFIATVRGNNTAWTEDSIVSMGPNITINSVEFISSTELKVHGSVAEDASIGFRTVSVSTDGYSQSLSKAFFVNEKVPVAVPILTIDGKNQLAAGAIASLTFKGENITFIDGKTTLNMGDGISVISISIVDANTLTASVIASEDASLGYRDVTISVGDVSATILNGLEVFAVPNETKSDFNGDHISDAYLYDEKTRCFSVLQMNSETGKYEKVQIGGPISEGWSFAGTGYINNDSVCDIIWTHSSGAVGAWQVSDFIPKHQDIAGASSDWQFLGFADITGDGRHNMIWQHTSGHVLAWDSDRNGAFSSDIHLGGVNPGDWESIGFGDMTGDKIDDILWRNKESGLVGYWSSNESEDWVSIGHTSEIAWKCVGTGDFDADGIDELLWTHDSGLTGIWDITDTGVTWNELGNSNEMGSDVEIFNIGDFNGDASEDVLFSDGNSFKVWTITDNKKQEMIEISIA